MRSLIVYASSHGTTEKAVRILCSYLSDGVDVWCVNNRGPFPNIAQYDLVMIGGSIHAGLIQRSITRFMEKNYKLLLHKKVALFLCCLLEGDQARFQFERVFPHRLRDQSIANGLFGGELIYSQMSFLKRMMVSNIMGVKSDVLHIDLNAIYIFAERCKHNRMVYMEKQQQIQ